MWPIATAWSISLSVGHDCEPCKSGWTDLDVIWDIDSGVPEEPCIRWGSRSPRVNGQFWRVSGWLKSIRLWGLGKRVICAETGGQMLTIYRVRHNTVTPRFVGSFLSNGREFHWEILYIYIYIYFIFFYFLCFMYLHAVINSIYCGM